MQGNPCYARLFADLTRTPQGAFSCPFGTIHLVSPNPIIASGGQSRAPPVAGGARRKPSEQGSARKAPRADAARLLRTALRPPNPRGFFDRLLNVAAPLSEDEIKKYKSVDDKYAIRGGYITQPLATRSKDDRPNLVYPVYHNGIEIWPDKQWIWEKNRLYAAIEKDEVVFNETKGKWSVRFKQYLRDENGVMRLGKPISILTGPYNQDGTKEIETIFAERIFNNPKPSELIKYLFSLTMMI